MKTRLLVGLSLLGLAACQGGDSTRPSEQSGSGPSFIISDGRHSGGNSDFFFLPPMVPDPSGSPLFQAGAFNPHLVPTITICALNLASTAPESAVLLTTPCKGALTILPAAVSLSDQLYQGNWKVPTSADAYYRIRVSVGSTELGFADLHSVSSGSELKNVNTGEFVARKDGSNLPIKFRIENFALCVPAGTGPCGTASIALSTGGTVEFTDPAGNTIGAVQIPAQGPAAPTVTVSIAPCTDPAGLPVDLPKFGSCVSITTDPVVSLINPASVFVCDLGNDLDLSSLTTAQKARVTLHRQSGLVLQALPHVSGCSSTSASFNQSLRGLVRALVQRDWKRASGRAFDLVAPKPLYALDVGAGGLTFDFSNFQFALPAKMEIVSGDGQVAPPGTQLPANPTVIVTDLMGDPVNGATVHFSASAGGTAGAASFLTGPDGLASATWTLSATPGANSFVASGRGIADPVNNGPRSTFDPFMSIQGAFNPSAETIPNPLQPVNLLTGMLTFSATGVTGDPLPINYGSAGWSYQIDGTVPATWLSSLVSPFGSTGAAGFGENHNACTLIASSTSTSWPAGNTTLYVRKNFLLTAAATVRIAVAIDNDVQIFVDGVDVGPGLLIHDGCPTQGSIFRDVALSAGTHVLAFRAVDRGGSSYFDAAVTVVPPIL